MDSWSPEAVKTVARAFREVVEAKYSWRLPPLGSAMYELGQLKDYEVPAACRLDLLVAKHANSLDVSCVRAVARLYVHSIEPTRDQPPFDERGDAIVDAAVDDEQTGPVGLLGPPSYLELLAPQHRILQEVAMGLAALDRTGERSRVRLTEFTLNEVHVSTLRCHAEDMEEFGLVQDCDSFLIPDKDQTAGILRLRRRLAAAYNALLINGEAMGAWKPFALRAVRIAWQRLFNPVDRAPTATELLHDVQEALACVRAADVHEYAREDLLSVTSARELDVATLGAMSRLMQHGSDWLIDRMGEELGRGPSSSSN